MDGIARRTCAAVGLALVATLCAAAPALATDGSVKGKKWHDVNANGVKDAGEPVVKDWWIYLDTNRNGVHDAGEPAAKTDSSGNYAITGIKWWVPNHDPRTYDVREKPVGNQPQPLDGCSFPSGCKYTLTFSTGSHIYSGKDFGNYQRGRIVVKKVNVGGTQSDAFDFTSSKLGSFSLAADDAGGKTFSSLEPGTYGIAEEAHAGYVQTSAACDDGSDPAAIVLAPAETVTCTFTNTRKATVTVTKTEGGKSDLSREWRFVLRGGPDQVDLTRTTAGGNPLDFGQLAPGAYTLCETDLPAGWTSSLGTAVDGTACVDLTLEPGEAETVAVDNTRPATTPPAGTPPASTPPSQTTDQLQVLPEEIISGTARLRGPSGCARRPFEARVSGRQISRVTFWLDGRRAERVVAKGGQTAFALRVDPRKVAKGVHRVRARVVFEAESRTAPRTLRLSFQRCARQVVTPQFTG
jgi:hypothetical protein